MKRIISMIMAALVMTICVSCTGPKNEEKPSREKSFYAGTDVLDFGTMYGVEGKKEKADNVVMYIYSLPNTTEEDIESYRADVIQSGFEEESDKGNGEVIYKNSSGTRLSLFYNITDNLFIVGYED
ncbi:MAG: hypothetical protein PUF72_01285 [Clostridiales bacterium]|nr:hypothetical protein [Clostridiales bacterium]